MLVIRVEVFTGGVEKLVSVTRDDDDDGGGAAAGF